MDFPGDPDEYDYSAIGDDFFSQAQEILGPLKLGECYGFFPALADALPRPLA